MKASLIDRGKYYRGLLVLIARDRVIDRREHSLIMDIGRMLDFDERFCEATITDLLRNKHISSEPILFDDQFIAKCFLRDALKLALADKEIHSHELSWLKTIARTNGLTDEWFNGERRRLEAIPRDETRPENFEIRQYV